MRTGVKLYKADQRSRKLSKNGERATQTERKLTVFVILDWASRQYTSGGAWAKPSKAFPLNYPRAIRKRVSRAVARLCSLPLILFFVGYNYPRGKCLSVRSVTPSWVRLSIPKWESKGLSATIFFYAANRWSASGSSWKHRKKQALDYLIFPFPKSPKRE